MLMFDSFFSGHVQMVPLSRTPFIVIYVCACIGLKIILQIGVRNHSGLECSHSTELSTRMPFAILIPNLPHMRRKRLKGGELRTSLLVLSGSNVQCIV